jgi:predicted dehydrogenase
VTNPENIGIGVAGLGYWGKNILSELRNLDITPRAIADTDRTRLYDAKTISPRTLRVDSVEEMLALPGIDAIIIALPQEQLAQNAILAAQAGKHILVEKPFASNLAIGLTARDVIARAKIVARVDYTLLSEPGIRFASSVVRDGSVGKLTHVITHRESWGPFRPNTNMLWDQICHDLAIYAFMAGIDDTRVSCSTSNGESGRESASVIINGPHVSASLTGTWCSPTRVRRFLFRFEKAVLDVDLLRVGQPAQFVDTSRIPDMKSFSVNLNDEDLSPLAFTISRWRSAIADNDTRSQALDLAMDTLSLLEAANASLQAKGRPTPVIHWAEALEEPPDLIPGPTI